MQKTGFVGRGGVTTEAGASVGLTTGGGIGWTVTGGGVPLGAAVSAALEGFLPCKVFVGTMKCLSCFSSLQPLGMTQGSIGCVPFGAAAIPVALVLTAPRGAAAAVVASTASAPMFIFILICWLGSADDGVLVKETGKLPGPGSSGSVRRAEQRREGEASVPGL